MNWQSETSCLYVLLHLDRLTSQDKNEPDQKVNRDWEEDQEAILASLNKDKVPISHFTFFLTYEWTQKARVLHNTRLERLASNKHSSILGQHVSCEENEVF
jgi:hypothetical protein